MTRSPSFTPGEERLLRAFMAHAHKGHPEHDMRSLEETAIQCARAHDSALGAFDVLSAPAVKRQARQRFDDFARGWLDGQHQPSQPEDRPALAEDAMLRLMAVSLTAEVARFREGFTHAELPEMIERVRAARDAAPPKDRDFFQKALEALARLWVAL